MTCHHTTFFFYSRIVLYFNNSVVTLYLMCLDWCVIRENDKNSGLSTFESSLLLLLDGSIVGVRFSSTGWFGGNETQSQSQSFHSVRCSPFIFISCLPALSYCFFFFSHVFFLCSLPRVSSLVHSEDLIFSNLFPPFATTKKTPTMRVKTPL